MLLVERIIPRDNGVLSSNTRDCAGFTIAVVIHSVDPLERGNLDTLYSINISILWIEEWDSDWKVLLAERIIPTGITACCQ